MRKMIAFCDTCGKPIEDKDRPVILVGLSTVPTTDKQEDDAIVKSRKDGRFYTVHRTVDCIMSKLGLHWEELYESKSE